MLKLASEQLRSINGVALWPTLAFVFFFSFFLLMLWWVITTPRKDLEHIAQVPLQDGHEEPGNTLDTTRP